MVHEEMPQAWWFDSHNLAKPSSPWLCTTLSELDEKTKQMLKLIDQDADSFAQRAEMYYKKRPVLVDMLGDLYRAHRSLAEQHDLLKLSSSGTRRTKFGPTSSCNQSWSPPAATIDGKGTAGRSSVSSNSVCSDTYDSESEVDDPEEEHDQRASEAETKADQREAELMRAEIKRLKEENEELQKAIGENAAALRDELAAKDEEKREVIRQLASCVDMVKEENRTLRECIRSSRRKKQRSPSSSPPPSTRGFDLKKLTKDLFSAKIFGAHCKHSGPLVAL